MRPLKVAKAAEALSFLLQGWPAVPTAPGSDRAGTAGQLPMKNQIASAAFAHPAEWSGTPVGTQFAGCHLSNKRCWQGVCNCVGIATAGFPENFGSFRYLIKPDRMAC
jgi:hypothetical protein